VREEDDDIDSGGRRWVPWAGAGVILVGFAAVIWFAVSSLSGTKPPEPPKVQQISIVQPPPPPPPPPEMEETPPEPEEEVEVPEPEPEPVADTPESDEPPPGEDLGLDAEGVAGADGFGLRAKKGGRGLIGGAGDPQAWYAGVLSRELQRVLSNVEEVRSGRYAVVVRIWVAEDGSIRDSEIVRGSGNAGVDAAIERALGAGVRMSEAPPADLPQPIRLQITSRS
jgi:protein TonB